MPSLNSHIAADIGSWTRSCDVNQFEETRNPEFIIEYENIKPEMDPL
jgi:hypothetical protein